MTVRVEPSRGTEVFVSADFGAEIIPANEKYWWMLTPFGTDGQIVKYTSKDGSVIEVPFAEWDSFFCHPRFVASIHADTDCDKLYCDY